jgi:transposase-like protein
MMNVTCTAANAASTSEPFKTASLRGQCATRNHQLPRLAYSLREAAEILGISYVSVWRLRKRGLLKCSKALRNAMVPRTELERFLKDTSC